VAENVFGEEQWGPCFGEDAGHVRPEVSGIGSSELFPGGTERLAGVSGSEDIHSATPRAAVEGGKVRPDRSLIQGLVFHPGHESGRGVCVPLDPTNSSVFGNRDMQPEFQSADSGAKGDPVNSFGI